MEVMAVEQGMLERLRELYRRSPGLFCEVAGASAFLCYLRPGWTFPVFGGDDAGVDLNSNAEHAITHAYVATESCCRYKPAAQAGCRQQGE